jgi:hypothetical protein
VNQNAATPHIYRIDVEGYLHDQWAAWLSETVIRMDNLADDSGGTTIVAVVPDQAGLRGLLNKLWDLNLPLVAVTRLAGDESARATYAPSSTTPGGN